MNEVSFNFGDPLLYDTRTANSQLMTLLSDNYKNRSVQGIARYNQNHKIPLETYFTQHDNDPFNTLQTVRNYLIDESVTFPGYLFPSFKDGIRSFTSASQVISAFSQMNRALHKIIMQTYIELKPLVSMNDNKSFTDLINISVRKLRAVKKNADDYEYLIQKHEKCQKRVQELTMDQTSEKEQCIQLTKILKKFYPNLSDKDSWSKLAQRLEDDLEQLQLFDQNLDAITAFLLQRNVDFSNLKNKTSAEQIVYLTAQYSKLVQTGETTIGELQTTLNDSKTTVTSLQIQVKTCDNKLSELKAVTDELRTSSLQALDMYAEQLENCSQKKMALERDLTMQQAHLARSKVLVEAQQEQLDTLNQIQTLQTEERIEEKKIHAAAIAAMTNDASDNTASAAALQIQLDRAKKDLAEKQAELEKQIIAAAATEQQLIKCTDALEDCQKGLKAKQEEVDAAVAAQKFAENYLVAAQAEVQRLGAALMASRDELEVIRQSGLQSLETNVVSEAEQAVILLKSKLDFAVNEAEHLSNEVLEANAKADTLQSELNALKLLLQKFESDALTRQLQVQTEADQYKEDMEDAKAKIAQLEADLLQCEESISLTLQDMEEGQELTELNMSTVAGMKKQATDLAKNLADAEQKCIDIEKALVNCEDAKKMLKQVIQALNDRLEEEESTNAELLKSFQKAQKDLAAAKTALSQSKKEHSAMLAENRKLSNGLFSMRKTIKKLEQDLEREKTIGTGWYNQLQAAQTASSTANGNNTALQAQVAALQAQVANQTAIIAFNDTELQRAQSELTRLTGLQAANQAMLAAGQLAVNQLQTMTVAQTALQVNIATLQSQLNNCRRNLGQLKNLLSKETFTRASAQAQLVIKQQSVAQLQQDKATLTAQLQSAQTALAAEQASNSANTGTVNTLTTNVAALTAQLQSAQTALNAEQASNNANTGTVNTLTANVAALTAQLLAAQTALTAEQSTNTANTVTINTLTGNVTALTAQLQSAQTALTAEQNANAVNITTINTLTGNVTGLTAQLQSAQTALTAEQNANAVNTATINTVNGNLTALTAQLLSAQSALAAEQSANTAQTTIISTSNANVATLTAQLLSAQAALAAEQNANAVNIATINTLTGNVNALTTQLLAAQNAFTAEHNTNTALQNAIIANDGTIAQLNTDLQTAQSALTAEQNANATSSGTINTLTANVVALTAQLLVAQTALTAEQASNSANTGTINTLTANVTVLTAQLLAAQNVFTAEHNTNTALQNAIIANDGTIAKLNTDLQTARSALTAEQNANATSSGTINTLTANVVALTAQLLVAQTALAAEHNTNTALQNAIDANNDTIAQLNDDVLNEQAASAALTQQLNDAQAALVPLTQQLEIAQATIVENTVIIVQNTATIAANAATIANLQAVETSLSADLNASNAEILRRTEELEVSQAELTASTQSSVALSVQLTARDQTITELNMRITQLERDISTAREANAAELELLNAEVTSSTATVANIQQNLDDCTLERQRLLAENQILKDRLIVLQSDHEAKSILLQQELVDTKLAMDLLMQQQREDFEGKKASLEAIVGALTNELKAEQKKCTGKCDDTVAELSRVQKALESVTLKLNNSKASQSNLAQALQLKVTQLQAQLAVKLENLSEQKSHSNAELDQLRSLVTRYQVREESMASSRARFQQHLRMFLNNAEQNSDTQRLGALLDQVDGDGHADAVALLQSANTLHLNTVINDIGKKLMKMDMNTMMAQLDHHMKLNNQEAIVNITNKLETLMRTQ